MFRIILILLIFVIAVPSYAGGVGFVDYNKIIENYNYAKITFQELDTKSLEIRDYLIKKEDEYNKLESPVQRTKFEQEFAFVKIKRNSNS